MHKISISSVICSLCRLPASVNENHLCEFCSRPEAPTRKLHDLHILAIAVVFGLAMLAGMAMLARWAVTP